MTRGRGGIGWEAARLWVHSLRGGLDHRHALQGTHPDKAGESISWVRLLPDRNESRVEWRRRASATARTRCRVSPGRIPVGSVARPAGILLSWRALGNETNATPKGFPSWVSPSRSLLMPVQQAS